MARKNKTVTDPAKAKQAKQKKMVVALAAVLVLAAAYAVRTMMALNSGPASSRPQVAVTTITPTTPTPAAPAPTPVAPTLSATPTASSPTALPTDASSQLVAAVRPAADPGQLQSFSRFASKDPFDSAGPKAGTPSSAPAGSGGSSPKGGSSGSGGGTAKPPATPPAPPAAPPSSAVISVNGVAESVAPGSNFPASNPIFNLVSLAATTAKVAIAGGSYATGQQTLTLQVNKPVTLVNTADGTRYTLQLYPQGTQVPASGGTSTTTSPTTTTPAAPTAPSSGG